MVVALVNAGQTDRQDRPALLCGSGTGTSVCFADANHYVENLLAPTPFCGAGRGLRVCFAEAEACRRAYIGRCREGLGLGTECKML